MSKIPSLTEALIPIFVLVPLLAINIFFADQSLFGDYSNHYILLIAAGVAFFLGVIRKVRLAKIWAEVRENLKSVAVPIVILFLVGALAGSWLISGIIPAMVYYGLQVLNPDIFLPATVIIAAIVSIATGSSWTTSATVGIALIGIGSALGIPVGMIAGAVISGAYFGDKMSPLSDTTNLAPAMAGTDLYTHIKYMTYTTIPSLVITFVVFIFLGLNVEANGKTEISILLTTIESTFNISPYLFLVPLFVVILILFKTKPVYSLASGVLVSIVFALIFQPQLVSGDFQNKSTIIAKSVFVSSSVQVSDSEWSNNFTVTQKEAISENEDLSKLFNGGIVEERYNQEELTAILAPAVPSSILIDKVNDLENFITVNKLKSLFEAKGVWGMLWTVLLIICAMIFGGVMDGVGYLSKITEVLLKGAKTIFGLFTSTVLSCLGLNAIASDQYLAIVIPGKMYKKAFEERGLAPENLSRTLEDSGTVTSVLIPWNTCGAYQAGVLGVEVVEYFVFAIFNWISPFVTLFFAYFMIKIRRITN